MSKPIEDYALIGDCHTAALVARDGAIDWLCEPRFDSNACFAALLGDDEHGSWRIAPDLADGASPAEVTRSYRDDTLILETVFSSPSGSVAVVDFMPLREDDEVSYVVRIVEGRGGRVAMKGELTVRFNYGLTTPWVTSLDGEDGITAVAGPDMITLRASVELCGEDMKTVARFEVADGERQVFVLSHSPSHRPIPAPLDVDDALARTTEFWETWASRCIDAGPHADLVRRSLMVLKAMTYAPTGGIVAAPTTSLPEELGGVRNYDYRYCWLRDSTITLFALMNAGYDDEARAWGQWLLRAVAGDSQKLRIMYGLSGERRLEEWEIEELPGYAGSKPVRIGNAASNQLQLDVYGQLHGTAYHARANQVHMDDTGNDPGWSFQVRSLEHLEEIWRSPDQGIWEMRGEPRHFVFSKVMVWVAFDSGVKSIEEFGFEGPLERWRALAAEVHAEICEKGFDAELGSFVQSYGSKALDASLLMLPFTGFLPIDDPRIAGTVAAIERELMVDGLLLRYSTEGSGDGLAGSEGAFLACSFWLVDTMKTQGRVDEATRLFEQLIGLANDVGLLAEEYDPRAKRQLGNFPQAFSHVALVNSALGLANNAVMWRSQPAAKNQTS